MNNIVRASSMPQVGQRDGNWVWNGSNWICDPDCDVDFPQPCPPFGPPVFSGPVSQPPWYPGANGGVSFGATAPANPVRGHMWWNGTTFWLFDGAAWVPIGGQGASGGTATGSTPPANPFPGQMWFNGSVLFVWDGVAWVPTSTTRSFVQSTAPVAPNPGDTWWDGTVMRIWDGSTWEVVGPGSVGPVPTNTEVFRMIAPAVTLAGANAFDIVPFATTPAVDTEGGWNATTKQFKPTKAGHYLFFTRIFSTGGANASSALLRNDNGTYNDATNDVVAIAGFAAAGTGAGEYVVATGMAVLNGTTDYVRFWVFSANAIASPIGGSVPMLQAFLMA